MSNGGLQVLASSPLPEASLSAAHSSRLFRTQKPVAAPSRRVLYGLLSQPEAALQPIPFPRRPLPPPPRARLDHSGLSLQQMSSVFSCQVDPMRCHSLKRPHYFESVEELLLQFRRHGRFISHVQSRLRAGEAVSVSF